MAGRAFTAATCVFALSLWSGAATAQTTEAPSGHWEGAIQVPGQALPIEVDLARAKDGWQGAITIPAQGLKGFPLSAIVVEGEKVSFAMKNVPGEPRFAGAIAKDGKSLSGDFRQGEASLPFSLTRTGEPKIEQPPDSTPVTKEVEGTWEGTLTVNATSLRLVVKLENTPGGPAKGTLTSLDQGGVDIPIAAVVQKGPRLTLVVPSIVATYDGALEDGQLKGKWTQGPGEWPLALQKRK